MCTAKKNNNNNNKSTYLVQNLSTRKPKAREIHVYVLYGKLLSIRIESRYILSVVYVIIRYYNLCKATLASLQIKYTKATSVVFTCLL